MIYTCTYSNKLSPECIAQLYLRNDSIYEQCHLLRVLPDAKTFSNISARIWNVFTNKTNCDVSMPIFKDDHAGSFIKKYLHFL